MPIDSTDSDARVYKDAPSLLQMFNSGGGGETSNPFSTGGSSQSSNGAEPQFTDLGADTQTSLLEAILVELRALNQNIREMN